MSRIKPFEPISSANFSSVFCFVTLSTEHIVGSLGFAHGHPLEQCAACGL